jgi:hypothetical protein
MVFGSILNWAVGRTLDFTLDSILWITKTTGQGIITLGYYVTSRNSKQKDEKEQLIELRELTKAEIEMLREQNNILKEELEILKKINPNLAKTLTEDLTEDLEEIINKETNIDNILANENQETKETCETNENN